jgi:hypothetical protein
MIHFFRNRVLTAVFVLTSLALFNAKADLASCGVNLGEAGNGNWAIFTLGNGVKQNLNMSGQSFVTGDVGAAGNGNVLLGSGQATINGNLYQHRGGKLSGPGTITGRTFQDAATDAFLDDAAADAQEASDAAFGMLATPPYQSLTNINQTMTITGSGKVVLQLQTLNLSSGTLTLSGAAGTCFIINVQNQFSLSNSAQIVLSGGVRPQDVLFNVYGTGSQVTLSGSSQFNGILLATKRTVNISGQTQVRGEVIANSVVVSGNASVVTPTTNR